MQLVAKYFIPAALVIAGAIHLLPLQGILGGDRLTALYGVALEDENLKILMRHRALMFGLLGGFLVWAAFRPSLYAPALLAGAVSVAGFLLIALQSAERNSEIARVVSVDVFVLILIAIAALLKFAVQGER